MVSDQQRGYLWYGYSGEKIRNRTCASFGGDGIFEILSFLAEVAAATEVRYPR